MRIKSASSLALIVSALLAGGCTSPSSPERASQTAPDANFAAYRTFGWQPPPAAGSEEPMRLLDSNIREAIRTEMTRRGYTEAKDDPDLWIAYETAADERLKSSPFRIGIGVGILPGLGASVGSFLSYGAARSRARDPGRFGKGAIEGVAAAESADNAVVPASLIPLFALGIPGSVIAAILIGAFMLHGVAPGPLMFAQQPRLVGGIYAAMIAASLALLVIGLTFQGLFAQVVRVPTRLVVPAVLFLCVVGAWLEGGGVFGVQVMLVFAVLGVVFIKLGFSVVNFLIGFVVGRTFELTFRQSIQILGRDPWNLVQHPIALMFLALTVLAVWRFSRGARRAAPKPEDP